LDELNIQIENEGFLNKNQEIVSDHIKKFLDLKGIESKNLKVQYKKLKLIENYFKRIYKNK
jgi:predicted ATPase with chaperone activity